MFLLAEVDLPTLLFGFVTMFATAVAMLYKDMRKDMKLIQDQAILDRNKCDEELHSLYKEINALKYGPCLREGCPLKESK